MSTEFNKWWNEDLLTEDNHFVDGTPAYWAWEGWCAGVKAERAACAKVVDAKIEEVRLYSNELYLLQVAAAIRARGNT